jgi:hypothetical protein
MPADRDALSGGAEVRFRAHGVLEVTELIADVREQLDERNLEIRRAAFAPIRHEHAQTIEHQAAETGVIFRQIIVVRFDQRLRAGKCLPCGNQIRWGTRP